MVCLKNFISLIIKCSFFTNGLLAALNNRLKMSPCPRCSAEHRPAPFDFQVTSRSRQTSPSASVSLCFLCVLKFRLRATSANPSLHPSLLHHLLSPTPNSLSLRDAQLKVKSWFSLKQLEKVGSLNLSPIHYYLN